MAELSDEDRALAIKRLETLPSGIKVVRLDGYELSRDQMIEEVKKKSKIGEQLVQKDIRYLKYVVSGK